MTLLRTRRTFVALSLVGACVVGAGIAIGLFAGGPPRPAVPQRDPRAADYDPVALNRALGSNPKRIVALFAEEPRQPEWASRMEAALTEVIGNELRGRKTRSSVAAVQCRTLICSLSLTMPPAASAAERTAAMLALQTPTVAGSVVFTPGRGIQVYLGFTPI